MRLFLVRSGEIDRQPPAGLDGGPPLLTENPAEAREWERRRPGLRYLTHEQLGRYNDARHRGLIHADALREAEGPPVAVNQ